MSLFTRFSTRRPTIPGFCLLRYGSRGPEFTSYFDGKVFGGVVPGFDTDGALEAYRTDARFSPTRGLQWNLVQAHEIKSAPKSEYILLSDQTDTVVLTTGDLDELRAQAKRISACGGECTAFQRIELS